MFQRRFSIGVWTEVFGIDKTEIGNDYPLGLRRHKKAHMLRSIRALDAGVMGLASAISSPCSN